ncbi:flippase [Halorientalis pallida]|uniref:Flippase n=1 Tax=Halorientalis pallida TaxID=2479928 RepID=A0A498L0M9_9EURY|nr:flippase [Halorientalis pallida]RXK46946.1 flippase [Halorientalis pallida]
MSEETGSDDSKQSTSDALATVVSGGAIISASKFISLGFGFLTQIVMAQLLTEAAYGEVVLTLAVVNIAGLIAKLGLDEGLTRELPHYEDSAEKAQGVIRAGIVIAAISSLTSFIFVYFSAPFVARQIFSDASLIPLFRVSAFGIPFIVFRSVSVSLARGSRNARVHAYVNQLFQPFVRLLFISGFVIAGFSAFGAVAGQISAVIVASLLALYLAKKTLPSFSGTPASMYRSVLTFSVPLIAAQGMGFINSNVDIYMIGYFIDSSAVGVYNIALQLGNIVTAVLGSIGFLLPPMLTRLNKKNQNVEMRRTYQVITKVMTIVVLPLVVVLFFAPSLVIGIFFGEKYIDGATALRVLLIGNLFAVVMGLNGSALVSLGDNQIISVIVAVESVINIVINILLVPVLGIVGAAVGMTISTIIGDSLGVSVLYKRHDIHPFTRSVFSPIVVVLLLSFIGYFSFSIIGFPTELVIILIGVAYVPLITTVAIEPEDEELLSRFEDHMGYDLSIFRQAIRILD